MTLKHFLIPPATYFLFYETTLHPSAPAGQILKPVVAPESKFDAVSHFVFLVSKFEADLIIKVIK